MYGELRPDEIPKIAALNIRAFKAFIADLLARHARPGAVRL